MYIKKRLYTLIFALTMMFLLLPTDVYAENFSISKSKVTMNIGDEIDLDTTGTNNKERWTSYNVNIATVN